MYWTKLRTEKVEKEKSGKNRREKYCREGILITAKSWQHVVP